MTTPGICSVGPKSSFEQVQDFFQKGAGDPDCALAAVKTLERRADDPGNEAPYAPNDDALAAFHQKFHGTAAEAAYFKLAATRYKPEGQQSVAANLDGAGDGKAFGQQIVALKRPGVSLAFLTHSDDSSMGRLKEFQQFRTEDGKNIEIPDQRAVAMADVLNSLESDPDEFNEAIHSLGEGRLIGHNELTCLVHASLGYEAVDGQGSYQPEQYKQLVEATLKVGDAQSCKLLAAAIMKARDGGFDHEGIVRWQMGGDRSGAIDKLPFALQAKAKALTDRANALEANRGTVPQKP